MASQESPRNQVICEWCTEEEGDYVTNSCGHQFCWPCIEKYRAESSSPENKCPICYFNQPLQLVQMDKTGQLQLEESALQRCFLECEDLPVYVISVIGERRTGKSFLMNYLMRVFRNLETKKIPIFGAENESLNGFRWSPGTDKVTEGIWIWGKPFILEVNEKKMAVFLLDTEGTKNTGHETASMKLFVLTMMISSHLVYNVNANLKETDIEYLEVYYDPNENDPFHPFLELKYFDVLVRDRPDCEDCEAEFAKSYIEGQIQNLGKRDMESILNMVKEEKVRCFLMPHPGNALAEGERGSLRDMNEDFQNILKEYLSDVLERAKKYSSVVTCKKMAAKLQACVEYLQNECNLSSLSELCKGIKTQAEKKTEMEIKIKRTEFQTFLESQTRWRLPNQMSTLVSEKATEVMNTFHEQLLQTRPEHQEEIMRKLLDQLKEEGETFCAKHKNNLVYIGLRAAVHLGLTAAGAAAIPLLLPAAAPVAAAGWFGWFSAAPAAAAPVSNFVIGAAAGGMAMLQGGVAYVMNKKKDAKKEDNSTTGKDNCTTEKDNCTTEKDNCTTENA